MARRDRPRVTGSWFPIRATGWRAGCCLTPLPSWTLAVGHFAALLQGQALDPARALDWIAAEGEEIT